MRVAILIVAYGNAGDVRVCVEALGRSTWRDFSVHVCENGGEEAYRLLRAEVPHDLIDRPIELVLAPGNLGFAGGNNFLARRLGAEWDALWILNPDTQPDPAALAALVKKLGEPGYGIIGARLVNPVTKRVQLYGARWRRWRADGYNIGRGAAIDAVPDTAAIEREMTYVNGASMLVSRAFVEAIGLMEEDYFLYCEEVEWCHRRGAFKLGYAHDAIVWHAHGSTIGSSFSRRDKSALSTYLTERNRLLLTRRLYPSTYAATALIALALIFRYPLERAWSNFAVALRGWRDGLRGRTGAPARSDMLGSAQ